ncbi:5-amino-6-(5-phosphoribosylamino)uracil reductase (plasmid) [Sinorhizobium meliloti]|uniref:dihydrofolate reductase family protein n=1 Tax=Rhizobium meliloti TaxID=382 RepID=UPI000B4A3EBA|nr:RibD family protein [Sinorhizobium meliloti]ASP74409.1 5-amino-6-(5-phosphoribosylamino)uracil reductase [Sinorhizobium meliloti]MDE3857503.1 RibD family protein [Sinorhizobium meliloti]MQW49613.1 5-amino-6-(5-phosphoribosylamino)uracil reductase [Sinorhizobium meliloti]MQW49664.1 5-amino-6-(5-phosphoribosylamino)uracil reductase [Sinorhizobium meliloti]RVI59685.1 RibD family protein [Sinorhizobium meliloti]
MRPYIICHMITSIDGRLHPSRFTEAAAGVSADALSSHYEEVAGRFEAEGWIVGRKTMSELATGAKRVITNAPSVAREPHVVDRNGRNLAIAIDPSGRIHYGQDHIGGDHIIAVLSEQVSDAYLAELREDGVSYIFAGPTGDDLPGAMAQLASIFGIRRLLLEGGGTINGAFLRHRLIDEFSTLIQPAVDGVAGSPSIVDYNGVDGAHPGAGQALRLIGFEALKGGTVWLRHAVEEAPGPRP